MVTRAKCPRQNVLIRRYKRQGGKTKGGEGDNKVDNAAEVPTDNDFTSERNKEDDSRRDA
jgi:hypothetical protein